jgi:hypothetical protein
VSARIETRCKYKKFDVNSRRKANKGNPTIWLSIDPMTVKQRIDRITERLERVRRQFETQVEAGYSKIQKED